MRASASSPLRGFDHFVLMPDQGGAHDAADLRIVVDNQNLSGAHETI